MIARCLASNASLRLAALIQLGQEIVTEDDLSCSEPYMRRIAHAFRMRPVPRFARSTAWRTTARSLRHADLVIRDHHPAAPKR